MKNAIDRAAGKIGADITAFVEAADRLVNLLGENPPASETDRDAAMDVYDRARRQLTGEDVSSA